jgi:hypothetical protein
LGAGFARACYKFDQPEEETFVVQSVT